MNPGISKVHFTNHQKPCGSELCSTNAIFLHKNLATILILACAMMAVCGCISDKVEERDFLASYQDDLARKGPQERFDTEGRDLSNPIDLIRPAPSEGVLPRIELILDPNSGKKVARLTIDQAISRALANSPEIRVVSFDPSIAKQEITRAAAEFDPAAFGRLNYDRGDAPINSIFEPGQSDTRLVESGVKQKGTTGAEWALSYSLTRSWDDLFGRALATRYEPMLAFQLKQPLLRDAWQEVNLAGVNIAKLEHRVALLGFRQKVEDISTEVITAYWRLFQARHDLDVQRQLLERTLETLAKVEGREEIDATDVHIKQATSYVKVRRAMVLQAEKRVMDAQDALVRLMADPQMNLAGELEIESISTPYTTAEGLEQPAAPEQSLAVAMTNNPAVQQARIAIEVADINIRVAENQRMPRLDLIGSAKTQALARDRFEAQDQLDSGDYGSYAVGLSLEYPLGNRQRYAELLQRKLERRKTVSTLQNTADQVATQVKERIRKVETNLAEIELQKEAAEAARIHLQALEDTEAVRETLTPEFLLVKLQAQEALAQAQRAETNAIVEFNIAMAELAQATGTVLELHEVKALLPPVLSSSGSPSEGDEAAH